MSTIHRLGLHTVDLWERDEGALGPPGATWLETEQAWNFTLYSRHATGVTLLLYDATNFVKPVWQLHARSASETKRDGSGIASSRGNVPARAILRLPGRRPGDRGTAPVRRPEDVARSLCRGGVFPPDFSRAAAMKPGRERWARAARSVAREEAGTPASSRGPGSPWHEIVIYELHVKGFTARANSGVTTEKRGTFLGLDRKDSVSEGTRCDGRGVVAGASVRSAGGQLLGLHDAELLCAAPGLRAARRGGGVSRDGPSVSRGGNRSVAGRGLQPHREGDRNWADIFLPRDRQQQLLPARPDGQLSGTTAVAGTCCAVGIRAVAHAGSCESLRHWAERIGVDGFRFDLASVMARDAHGQRADGVAAMISEISALAIARESAVRGRGMGHRVYLLGRSFPGLAVETVERPISR